MNKRVLKYSLAAAVLGSFLFSGCNSLDQEPTDKFTEKVFWKSPDRARLVLNMGYNQMYSHGKIWDDECLTDNMIEFRGNNDRKAIRQGLARPTTGLFRSEWKWSFEGIKTCNVFMGMVDLVPNFDGPEKERMKAEVRFIRAMLYFRMTTFWGDIPFFLQDISLEESRNMTRTRQAVVLAELHRELGEILAYLPAREQLQASDNGRITKAAAMVLDARIYLYEGNMGKVKEICGKLIDEQGTYGHYELFTDDSQQYGQNYTAYENLFTSKFEYNKEVILDYAAMPVSKEWQMWNLTPPSVPGTQVCSRAATKSLVDSYLKADGTIWAEGDAAYANRDPRFAASIVYNGASWRDVADGTATSRTINTNSGTDAWTNDNASATAYYTRKYFDPSHNSDFRMNNNIIIMRWAEVLLMYAEACESLGDFGTAEWNKTIKPIRERAGFPASAAEFGFSHGESMDKVIARERRVEMAFEGTRYLDLMRMPENERAAALNGVVEGAKFANGGASYINVASYTYSSRDKWWSLPQSEMELAPGLRPNNPGY